MEPLFVNQSSYLPYLDASPGKSSYEQNGFFSSIFVKILTTTGLSSDILIRNPSSPFALWVRRFWLLPMLLIVHLLSIFVSNFLPSHGHLTVFLSLLILRGSMGLSHIYGDPNMIGFDLLLQLLATPTNPEKLNTYYWYKAPSISPTHS